MSIGVQEWIRKEGWAGGMSSQGWRQLGIKVAKGAQTGGEKGYKKRHPEWGWKVPVKWSGCICHLIVKIYPHTPLFWGNTILNTHILLVMKMLTTQLSKDTHIKIAEMIRIGILHAKIVHDKICRLMN